MELHSCGSKYITSKTLALRVTHHQASTASTIG